MDWISDGSTDVGHSCIDSLRDVQDLNNIITEPLPAIVVILETFKAFADQYSYFHRIVHVAAFPQPAVGGHDGQRRCRWNSCTSEFRLD